MNRDRIAEAKQRLKIPELWERIGLPGPCKRMNRAPWRHDRTPSLSISPDGLLWKDFGTGEGGDAICFLEKVWGINRTEACKQFIELAGCNDLKDMPKIKRDVRITSPVKTKPDFPELTSGTEEQRQRLAQLRGVSVAAVERMIAHGCLFFGNYKEEECWIITDKEKVSGQARKLSGQTWGKAKALTLPNSRAHWPIGVNNQSQAIILVEGGPDALAAHQLILEQKTDTSVVTMLGAAMNIHPSAIPLFAGKVVTIVPHNDQAGMNAFSRWAKQLAQVAEVFRVVLPQSIKDLNDYVKIPVNKRTLFMRKYT